MDAERINRLLSLSRSDQDCVLVNVQDLRDLLATAVERAFRCRQADEEIDLLNTAMSVLQEGYRKSLENEGLLKAELARLTPKVQPVDGTPVGGGGC
jgi:predicted RecB family endonuclease